MASVSFVRGKWRCLVRKTGHKVAQRSFDQKDDAIAWGKDTERQMARQEYKRATRDTMADLAQRYIDAAGLSIKRSVKMGMDVILRRGGGHIGDVRCAKLTVADVVRHCTTENRVNPGAPLSHATVDSRLVWIGILLRHARSVWNIHAPDVIDAARAELKLAGRYGNKTERDQRVTQEQVDKLADEMNPRHPNSGEPSIDMGDIVRFAVVSALRRSEICSLRWSDLQPATQEIWVRDRKDPKKKIGNHQLVPLLDAAFAIIQRQPRAGALIFPVPPKKVTKRFAEAVNRCGYSDIVFHDLRHEAISRLFEMGYNAQYVMRFSGHRTSAMLDRYTHLQNSRMPRLDRAAPADRPQIDQAALIEAIKLLQAQNDSKAA